MNVLRLLIKSTWLSILTEMRYPLEFFVSFGTMAAVMTITLVSARTFGLQVFDLAAAPFLMNLLLIEAISGSLNHFERRGKQAEETYSWPISLEVQIVISSVSTTLKSVVTLGLLYATLGVVAKLPVTGLGTALLYAVPLFVATMGLGYLLCGLQLIFKQVRAVASLVNMVFFGSAFVPVAWLEGISSWVPYTTALKAIRGESTNHVVFLLSCIFLFVAGLAAFRGMKRMTIRFGLAGVR